MELAERVSQAILNYKDGLVAGIEAVDMIINNELPHACKTDETGELFKKYLDDQLSCGSHNLLDHLGPILSLNNNTASVVTHAASKKKDLDQWSWMRGGLEREVERLNCEQKLLKEENDQDLKKSFDGLVKIKEELREREADFYSEFMANDKTNKLITKGHLGSACLFPAGKFAKATLDRECPATGGLGLVTSEHDQVDKVNEFFLNIVSSGYDDGLICRGAMKQSRFTGANGSEKFKIGTRTNRWGRESSGSLHNKCMTERLLSGDLNSLFNKMQTAGGYLNPELSQKMKDYQKIKNLEANLLANSPLLASDEMKVAAGLSAYLQTNEASISDKFSKALALAKKSRREKLAEKVEQYSQAIAAKTHDEVEDNLSDYELLTAVKPYFNHNSMGTPKWNRNMSCNLQRRYIRQGGMEQIKKDIADMLVVALPLGAGVVAKGLLIAGNSLRATRVLGLMGNGSKMSAVAEGKNLLAASVAGEGGALGVDVMLINDKLKECQNFMVQFFDNPKSCSPKAKNRQALDQRYGQCKQLLNDSVLATAAAALGGAFVIGAQTKRLLNAKKAGALPKAPDQVAERSFDAVKNSLSSNKRKFFARKYASKKYTKLDEQDKVYFAGLADLMEKDLRSSGLSELAIKKKVKGSLDEIMATCKKARN